MEENAILATDSYKICHHLLYPPGTEALHCYLESRGGVYDRTLFFGLSYALRHYLGRPVTRDNVEEADAFCRLHGVPFPKGGWHKVVDEYGGHLPIRIRAVGEGRVVPTHNVLLTCESLDPELFWLVTWVETFLMRGCWYPTTVATLSWHLRRVIRRYLDMTADDPAAEIDFKLHDFGGRGVSSGESAAIGGAAHLAAGWRGSDTIEGIRLANQIYGAEMAGFSIPATEHSTMTTWGKEHEREAFDHVLRQFGGPGKIVACVSDSYDIFAAVDYWIGKSEEIRKSGTTLVIRPDSGDPIEVVLDILVQFGRAGLLQKNKRGFDVLPPHFRIIQGDGVNPTSIEEILRRMVKRGFSTSSIGFGMGGALLQKVDRDTQKFAYKCSAAKVDGAWRDVYKDPVTDPGKRSKRGRLDLVGAAGHSYETVVLPGGDYDSEGSALHTYYDTGKISPAPSLDLVRERARCAAADLDESAVATAVGGAS